MQLSRLPEVYERDTVMRQGGISTSVLCGSSIAQFEPDCFAQYCSKAVIASWNVSEGTPTRPAVEVPLLSCTSFDCLSVTTAVVQTDDRGVKGLKAYTQALR